MQSLLSSLLSTTLSVMGDEVKSNSGGDSRDAVVVMTAEGLIRTEDTNCPSNPTSFTGRRIKQRLGMVLKVVVVLGLRLMLAEVVVTGTEWHRLDLSHHVFHVCPPHGRT